MDHLISFLERAAQLALWDFLTFTLGLASAIAALLYFRRRRHDRFSLYPSYRLGTGHSLYPNVIYFAARNLGDSPIVLCRPNFRPSKHLLVDDNAHGNLATEDYELKFRPLNAEGQVTGEHSFTTVMLRHRDSALAYLPISRSYDAADFGKLVNNRNLGWITFDIVTVAEGRPRVVRIRQEVRRLAMEPRDYHLGRDPAAGARTI